MISSIGAEVQTSGIVLPIETQATATSAANSSLIISGNIGQILREATQNVIAVIEKLIVTKQKYIFYVQFMTAYKLKGTDSATLAVATALYSILQGIPVKQEVAITGGLSVQGEALPVENISDKVHAAIEGGLKKIFVPRANLPDIHLEKELLGKVTIVPVECIYDVLKEALEWKGKQGVLKKLKRLKE